MHLPFWPQRRMSKEWLALYVETLNPKLNTVRKRAYRAIPQQDDQQTQRGSRQGRKGKRKGRKERRKEGGERGKHRGEAREFEGTRGKEHTKRRRKRVEPAAAQWPLPSGHEPPPGQPKKLRKNVARASLGEETRPQNSGNMAQKIFACEGRWNSHATGHVYKGTSFSPSKRRGTPSAWHDMAVLGSWT